jgi:uncharacterized protein (TIGR02246 family)
VLKEIKTQKAGQKTMQDDEQAIRELVATWLSASEAGDTEKVLSLMAEDVVFLVTGQPPMRGKSAFAASQEALADINMQTNSEIQEIKVFGEWAYLWTKLTVVITPKSGGQSVRRSGNTLSILQKQNDAWVVFRDANMLAVVPQ